MARIAAADGITHVVCTPHANAIYVFDPAGQSPRRSTTAQRARSRKHRHSPWAAAATFISPSTTSSEAKADPARFSINGLGYLLVEVPDYGLPPGLTETF